jgi:hypothetical protein
LPFVDVVNGSTVTLSTDTAPTVVDQTDGTITVVLPQAQASITGIVTGSRLLVYNETTATIIFNDIVAGTSYSLGYANGTTFSTGDVVRVTIEYQSGVTAKQTFLASAVAGAGGWSILAEQVDDPIYIGYGHDGSTLTGTFAPDYADAEIDIKLASNWYASEMYSWFVYNKSTPQGIHSSSFLVAKDAANLVLSGKIDNITDINLRQLDNIRVSRPDGIYPVKDPTTGEGGLDVTWKDTILIVTVGSGPLTTAQDAKLNSLDTTNLDVAVSTRSSRGDVELLL